MSGIIRPTAVRLSAAAAPRAALRPRAMPKRVPRVTAQPISLRRYATDVPPSQPAQQQGGSGGGNGPMLIVLAAILGVGVGGYYYLKPVRDVAAITHQGINAAKENASALGDYADYAKSLLPPGAFALYQALASQPGGVNGFLASLKDKDLSEVLDNLKKVGGDDVKKVVEKVQKKVEEAKGDVKKVDWKALATELKDDLPAGSQQLIDTFIGKIPDKADIDALIKKAKDIGEDQLKQVEAAASKVLKKVEEARKDGKGQADAFLKGLKEAAPADVDSLIKQLKDAAKKAGLPADTAEAWLKSKAEDGKVDAEALSKQVEGRLKDAAEYIPGEPKDLVKQVEQVSPSLAKLLQQALQQADIVDKDGNRKKN
ncbi:hypothetical protein I316_04863 [Kwoniella heveanensis BCC8398]|uniref:Uncharacterized protein n=1 Tax=Kwoniella heveanensis BCC8398 TaxID=1296120 RepID=A0A1B9GQY8_9TREE|nr:hypothetical protein I316_04863 [Kwoniella heveanensis BCC8398]